MLDEVYWDRNGEHYVLWMNDLCFGNGLFLDRVGLGLHHEELDLEFVHGELELELFCEEELMVQDLSQNLRCQNGDRLCLLPKPVLEERGRWLLRVSNRRA